MAFAKFGSAAPVTTFDPTTWGNALKPGDRIVTAGRQGILMTITGRDASVLLDGEDEPITVLATSVTGVA